MRFRLQQCGVFFTDVENKQQIQPKDSEVENSLLILTGFALKCKGGGSSKKETFAVSSELGAKHRGLSCNSAPCLRAVKLLSTLLGPVVTLEK